MLVIANIIGALLIVLIVCVFVCVCQCIKPSNNDYHIMN